MSTSNSDPFSSLIGNSKVKGYLRQMLESQKFSQSLLFAGPDGIGKGVFSRAMAAKIMAPDNEVAAKKVLEGTHPDLHIYKPEGKVGMHSIGSMRAFNEEVYLAPFEAKKKVFIIEDAERMVSFSANALLKTFEEPAKHSIIILTSSNPNLLLATVRSRCTAIHFHAVEPEEIASYLVSFKGIDGLKANQIAKKARGSVAKALEIAEHGDDQLCKAVLTLLMQPPKTYKELNQAVKAVSEQMEQRQKESEKKLRSEIDKIPKEQITALYRDSIEKEIDGASAIVQAREADVVFETIQGWFRDLHLLSVKGNPEYLYHPDLADQISRKAVQGNPINSGLLIPMEDVEKAVKEAQMSLMRSTSFSTCLETLLLKVLKV